MLFSESNTLYFYELILSTYLQGIKIGDFGQLSAKQITMIDKLQRQIIIEENKLSSRLASLQEDVVDQPIAMAAKICDRIEQGIWCINLYLVFDWT